MKHFEGHRNRCLKAKSVGNKDVKTLGGKNIDTSDLRKRIE